MAGILGTRTPTHHDMKWSAARWVAVAISPAVALFANPPIEVQAQQALLPPPPLLRTDLQGIPGQEVMIQLVQIPPNGRAPRHLHPDGHEIIYVLEGETILEIEGHPPRSAKAGEILHVLPNVPHGGGNSSSTAPLKLLVVRIKDKTKPILAPVSN